MRILIMTVIFAGAVMAQDSRPATPQPHPTSKPSSKPAAEIKKPRQSKEALATFKAMNAHIYRPRDEGVKELEGFLRIRITFKDKTKEPVNFGPILFRWRNDTVNLWDEAKRPVKLSQPQFWRDVFSDLMGRDHSVLIERVSMRMKGEKAIDMGAPTADDAPFPVLTRLELDDKGRLAKQIVFDMVSGKPREIRSFDYRARGKKSIIFTKTSARPSDAKDKPREKRRFTYQEVGGIGFARSVRITSENGDERLISFEGLMPSKYESKRKEAPELPALKKKAKPSPVAPPKQAGPEAMPPKPTSKPTSRPSKG